MSDVNIISGGAPTKADVLVNADQTTIVGDGSLENPLRAANAGVVPLLAAAVVDDDGNALSNTGFSSISRLNEGQYSLTLANPPASDAQVVPVVTLLGTGMGTVAGVVDGVIEVRTIADDTGLPTDFSFFVVVAQAAAV